MITAVVLVWGYMNIWYFIALQTKKNSVADVAWGGGFILISLYTFYTTSLPLITYIPHLLTLIWGVRLITHIGLRSFKKPEDPRYARWRAQWYWVKLRSYLQVFMLQGICLYIISLPLQKPLFVTYTSWPLALIAGGILWLIGFALETVADYQLKVGLQKLTKPGIVRTGLWAYSRHPNYVGEALLWWGIWLMSYTHTPLDWLFSLSPLLITFLLRYVSGVPLAEEQLHHVPGFREYTQEVPIFLPLKGCPCKK